MHRRTCPICGDPFIARRSTRKTCSDRCRVLMHRRRRFAHQCQANGLDQFRAHQMAAAVHRGRSPQASPESPRAPEPA